VELRFSGGVAVRLEPLYRIRFTYPESWSLTLDGGWQYLPDADPDFDVVYAIRPRSAMMWRLADYEGSQRRSTC
jgi:hypothetical protein